jgi:hypothetical protein
VLFGQYPEEAGVTAKSNDMEVWTILYEIQQQMKVRKSKIDIIK